MITAKKATEMTKLFLKDNPPEKRYKKELIIIDRRIRKAAKQGYSSAYLPYYYDTALEEYLKDLGYEVDYSHFGVATIISWEEDD